MKESENENRAIKSGVWYIAASFFVKGIGFIITPIFTRMLTQVEFGQYNNFLSWLSILTIIVSLNLEASMITARFDFDDDFDNYILSIRILSILVVLFWSGLIWLFSKQFEKIFDMDSHTLLAMLIYLLFIPSINLFQSRERFRFEYKKSVFCSIAVSVSTAVLSLLLVFFMADRFWGRTIGLVLPVVFCGICIDICFYKNSNGIKILYWKYAIPICIPYILHLLSLTVLNSIDKIFINKFCGAIDVAIYSLAYTCGTIITMVASAINSAYAPWLGEKLNNEEYVKIKSFSYRYIAGFEFIVAGIMLIAPEILYVLGGEAYFEARYVISPVAIGCVFQFIYMMFVNVEQFKKKTLGMSIASLIAALINVILNWILIPYLGYLVAAYTTLIGFGVLLLIHMHLVKMSGLSFIYDYRYICIIVGISVALMCCVNFLYKFSVARYLVGLVYCLIASIILYRYRKVLIDVVNRKRGK